MYGVHLSLGSRLPGELQPKVEQHLRRKNLPACFSTDDRNQAISFFFHPKEQLQWPLDELLRNFYTRLPFAYYPRGARISLEAFRSRIEHCSNPLVQSGVSAYCSLIPSRDPCRYTIGLKNPTHSQLQTRCLDTESVYQRLVLSELCERLHSKTPVLEYPYQRRK